MARNKPAPPRLVVGIGASAGGLEAFRTFLTHMPADSGMAFVLVQHLDPNHRTMLTELLRPHTAMPVIEASSGMRAEPNHIFVIPSNATLLIEAGVLQVKKPAPPRQNRRPIDSFFSSLAEDQGEHAVCIVLSGTGRDGTAGVRLAKEQGGLTLAQATHDSSAMSGMPQSAAATGLVDHVVPVAEMPALLLDHQRHLQRVAPHKDGDGARRDMATHLAAISALVRTRTGHDFSGYKPNTLVRRIQRRMQVLRVDTVPAFIERLRKEPREVELLFREFLIGVTQFFRDPQAFAALEAKVMPQLVVDKGADAQIRIWVPACATGEEVYSIAILVKEGLERADLAPKVQIFGTDIDDVAVTLARAARFPKKLEGISPERVARWFVEDGEEYCLVRAIRDMCVFSTHDVIKDPPFSKLDLISCRNLLIYLAPPLQDRLMQTFHYALRSGGFLCLGQSEGVSRRGQFFDTLDKKQRIFVRRDAAAAAPQVLPSSAATKPEPARRPTPPLRTSDAMDGEVRRAVEKYSPAYVVIDRHQEILRFSGGEVGRYLEPSAGAASLNLLALVRKALRPAVRAAVQKAYADAEPVVAEHTSIRIEGRNRSIRLIVEPLVDERRRPTDRWVLIFQETGVREARGPSNAPHLDVQALEHELLTTKTQLRSTIDELETANEEMKSANEEFQSVNEELQSSNEELETAKEEMQSVNEELQTINAEVSSKNDLLTRLNSDLRNLLDSTHIATVFLDARLRIKYFTPPMTDLLHLRESDRDRAITELAGRLQYATLRQDVARVLRDLTVVEQEVRLDGADSVFQMRMRPYRTIDNVIDGVVITFVDITASKRHEQMRAQLAAIVESSQDAIIGLSFEGTIGSWNSGAQAIFGYPAAEAIGQLFSMLVPNQADEVPHILRKLRQGERIEHFEIDGMRKDGARIDVSLTISPVRDSNGNVIAASTIARDFSERKRAEAHRDMLMAELDHRVKNILMVVSSLVSQTLLGTGSA
ncbi:MAG TPA: chemotaxis protein CheB, partial [Nitrospiraceae bacterium]|nr:chemotaxis protein CheB [Nitrospiraceae bacterium]